MGHGDKLLELAEKIDAPVTTTFRGKGVIDEYDPLYVGSHGTIGSTVSASTCTESRPPHSGWILLLRHDPRYQRKNRPDRYRPPYDSPKISC